MSLRLRLFLIILLINLGTVAAVQLTSYVLHTRWLRRHVELYRNYFQDLLEDVYAPELPDGVPTVRRVLRVDRRRFHSYFADVLLTNGRTSNLPGSVDLNPIGAAHRDPWRFPASEIRAGIQRAVDESLLVEAGDGFCVPISAGDRVVGGAWFQPFLPPPQQLSAAVFAIPVLLGTIIFGLIVNWILGRGMVRPLQDLSAAAGEVGAGRYYVRVPHLPGTRELDGLIDAFNRMTEKVEGHHGELEREVRAATEEAQRKERALRLSGRLASIGTLAAGIAHEINNPIGGMLNAVRRLEKSQQLSERERVYVGLIRDGLERVGRIASRVLDFSPKQIEPLPFDPQDAVEAARALVDHRLREQGVEVRTAGMASLPQVVGDRHEFQQVLLNLFLNSLDVLEGRPDPRWIAVSGRRLPGEDRVEILVEDNGPGMAPSELDRVMDPFFSGKGRPDASGLGMFISYSIITNLGGELEVESDLGKGFRVRIRMPIGGGVPRPGIVAE